MWSLQSQWGEAASRLADVVNDDLFRSLEAKSKHAMWLDLADICTRHPREVAHLRVEAILRAGIRRFTDEASARPQPVWTSCLLLALNSRRSREVLLCAFT